MYNSLHHSGPKVVKRHIFTIQTSFISINFYTRVEIATNS